MKSSTVKNQKNLDFHNRRPIMSLHWLIPFEDITETKLSRLVNAARIRLQVLRYFLGSMLDIDTVFSLAL